MCFLQFTKQLKRKDMKILIADDDMFNLLIAKAMIQKIIPKVELIEANSGKDAFAKAISVNPDLIFMDVQMPEMDGHDATIAIRKNEQTSFRHVPIIGLSAGGLEDEMKKCFLAGMDNFLTKPINIESILETIRCYIPKSENIIF